MPNVGLQYLFCWFNLCFAMLICGDYLVLLRSSVQVFWFNICFAISVLDSIKFSITSEWYFSGSPQHDFFNILHWFWQFLVILSKRIVNILNILVQGISYRVIHLKNLQTELWHWSGTLTKTTQSSFRIEKPKYAI